LGLTLLNAFGIAPFYLFPSAEAVNRVFVNLDSFDMGLSLGEGCNKNRKEPRIFIITKDGKCFAGVGDSVAENETALSYMTLEVPFWRHLAMTSLARASLN
jgi:hypothetical protein